MIPTRYASTHIKNPKLLRVPAATRGNVAWLRGVGAKAGVILLGGTSLADFRIRVAQSQLRFDLTPSCWSLSGILRGERIVTVPLGGIRDTSAVPAANGVEDLPVSAFDDTDAWPNLAVLRFSKDPDKVASEIPRVMEQRSVVDIPSLITSWLSFIWATRDSTLPLTQGIGLPSSAFVETVYALGDVELTPSLASSASCPEAIWQSARYWYEYFEETSKAKSAATIHPLGQYVVRQHSAAVKLAGKYDPAPTAALRARGHPPQRKKKARRKA